MQNAVNDIISSLKITFAGSNSEAIRSAQQRLKFYTQNILEFYQLIYKILTMPIESQIKDAAATYLKGVTYSFSSQKLPENTLELVNKLYQMMLNSNDMNHKHKYYLAVAIQYMLNNDQRDLYKQDFFKILLNDLQMRYNAYRLDSIILGLYSYLNSLLNIEAKIEFTKKTFLHLKNMAYQLIMNLNKNKQDQSLKSTTTSDRTKYLELKSDLTTADTLFDLLEILIQRLEDQYQQSEQILLQIEKDIQFKKILYSYLIFNSSEQQKQKSIFVRNSLFDIEINKIKEKVFQITYNIYTDAGLQFIDISYSTLSNQVCRVFSPKKHDSRLMIRIFQFLEKYIVKNAYYQIFSVISVDLFMKSLMYTKSSIDEINIMNQDPKQFVQITEEFCENFTSNVLKIKAGSLIRQMVQKIDGMIHNAFFILLMLIKSSYTPIDLRTTMQFKQAYEILEATDFIKTQNSLLCLALLFQKITERPQILTDFKIFMTQYLPTFQNQTNELVLLRLINLVGFSREFIYLPLVIQKMRLNDTFRTQGFHAFDRIIKKPMNFQQQQFFTTNLISVIDLMKADDPIFETMLFKNSQLIKNNVQLSNEFIKILLKNMQKQLSLMKKQNNNVFVFFNLLLGVIQKETDILKIDELEQKFLNIKIQSFIQKGYFQNIIEIMDMFLSKKNTINQSQKYFYQFTIQRINQCYKSRFLYYYYNKIIFIETKYQNISLLFEMLYKLLFLQDFDQDILTKHLTLLICQIILKFPDNPALPTVIQGIIKRLQMQQNRNNGDTDYSKARLLDIILTSFYCSKQKTYKTLLIQNTYYDLIKYLIQNQKFFKLDIDKKTYIFGMCRILEIQIENQRYIKQVLGAILKMLNSQYNSTKIKQNKKNLISNKNRKRKNYNYKKKTQDQERQEIQEIEAEIPFEQTIVSISQANSFKKYKLIFYQLNQFLFFQQLWRSTCNFIKIQLTQEQTQVLRDMLEIYKDENDKTRIIFKIKKDY